MRGSVGACTVMGISVTMPTVQTALDISINILQEAINIDHQI